MNRKNSTFSCCLYPTAFLYFTALLTAGLLPASDANATIYNLTSLIDGAQANMGNGTGSTATGSATATYNDVTGDFGWNIEWTPLLGNITVAHFHGPAAAGANAGVQVPITDLVSPSMGSAPIDAAQGSDLLSGLWYINIHSDRDPGGEIRGQVNLIPEPTTAGILALGIIALATGWRRVNQRRH